MTLRNALLFVIGLFFVVLTLADLLHAIKPKWHSGWICVAALLLNAAWFALSAKDAADKFPWFADYERGFWACVVRDSLVAAQVALILLAVSLILTESGGIVTIVGNEPASSPWPLAKLSGRWAWIGAFIVAGLVGNGLAFIDSRAQTNIVTIEQRLEARSQLAGAPVQAVGASPTKLTLEQRQTAAKYREGWTWINLVTMACFVIGCCWAYFGPTLSGSFLDFDRLVGYGSLLTVALVCSVAWWKGVF